ncbi:hypothetical protein DPMN_035282 [Dreissena polymorpha]|uniref:Uncharacterized protein n=1 Tax=Dreissena polymorpha TaxID=45954 RepID=A0A9D4RKV7_DREPO|nr:hypothetical protein DPMN_035282 [Dreissena polymorpha]
MEIKQKGATIQRRSSMDLINMSTDFRNAIANLSSSQNDRASAANSKIGEQMGDDTGRQSEPLLPPTVGRQRRSSIDVSVLPVASARRQSRDLRVDQNYIKLQQKMNIEKLKVPIIVARGRRASVDVSSLKMTSASILTGQKKITPMIHAQDLFGDDEESFYSLNRRRSSVGIALMVPRHTNERRNSAPIEAVDDPSLTCDPNSKYKRNSFDIATGSNENKYSKFPSKWFELRDRIQREKLAAVRISSASPTRSDPGFVKSSDNYPTEHRLDVGASQSEKSVVKSTSESPDFAGTIRLLVTPPSPDHQRKHRQNVNNDCENMKTETSNTNQYSIQNIPSVFADNRRRGSVDIINNEVEPHKAQRKDARHDFASKQFGGKHTSDRHTKKTMYGSQIKQYLESLEKDLPTHVLLEIKRLRAENAMNLNGHVQY